MKKSTIVKSILLSLVATSMIACNDSNKKKSSSADANTANCVQATKPVSEADAAAQKVKNEVVATERQELNRQISIIEAEIEQARIQTYGEFEDASAAAQEALKVRNMVYADSSSTPAKKIRVADALADSLQTVINARAAKSNSDEEILVKEKHIEVLKNNIEMLDLEENISVHDNIVKTSGHPIEIGNSSRLIERDSKKLNSLKELNLKLQKSFL